MGNNYLPAIVLFCFVAGLFNNATADENKNGIAPMVYVERCGFDFNGKNCGAIARDVIYFSSEEFLSYTDNWAVGRKGAYKMYLSCLDPEDEEYINGTRSLITVVVSGPGLGKAHDIARQLISAFSTELAENSGNISHCVER